MAVSGKTAAPHEIPYFLDGDAPPNMATVTKAMADRLQLRLNAIDPGQVIAPGGAGDVNKLLIVQNTGAAAAKAMSGDVTINAAGVAAIGANKVTAPKIGILPGCRVLREAKQSIPNKTYTPILFNVADRYDTDAMHDPVTNSDQIVIKTAGTYSISGFLSIEGNATGLRNVVLTRNAVAAAFPPDGLAEMAVPAMAAPEAGAAGNALTISAIATFAVNDIIRMAVWQNSGGALNTMGGDGVHTAELAVQFVGAK